MTTTKSLTISAFKVADQGARYTDQFTGTRVIYTTYEGTRLTGAIDGFTWEGYPIIRFADGKWARGDLHLELA